MFKLIEKHRAHGMKAIESHTLTPVQIHRIRNFINRNYEKDPAYLAKQGAEPFLQGCDAPTGPGATNWALIEFWSQKTDRIEGWIKLLNEYVFDAPVEDWEIEFWGK